LEVCEIVGTAAIARSDMVHLDRALLNGDAAQLTATAGPLEDFIPDTARDVPERRAPMVVSLLARFSR